MLFLIRLNASRRSLWCSLRASRRLYARQDRGRADYGCQVT
jgi:hypothetical protein